MTRRLGRATTTIVPATLLHFAASVLAQAPPSGDPVVLGPDRDLEFLHIYDVDLAIELEWRRNVNRREDADGDSTRDIEDRLREILDVQLDGFMGHPNIVEFDLGGRFWFEQRWFDLDTSTVDERVNQFLLDWDAAGFFFKESKIPFTIYTRQNTSDIDRQFGGTLENQFQETGIRVNFRDPVVPTNLQLFNRRIEQRDLAADRNFIIDQLTFQGDGRVELAQTQTLAWDFELDDIDESGDLRLPRSFDRFQGNIHHSLVFGDDQQHSLRTQARWFDVTGDQTFRQFYIDPRLRLRHSDDLSSWYEYTFESNQRNDQDQRLNRFTANVEHQLFESVTTIASAGFNLFDIPTDSFESDEVFGRVETQYLKQVPYGQLSTGFNAFYSHIDQTDRGTGIDFTDQLFTFSPADLIVIDQRNIEPNSIVITNVTGIIVYTENIDYSVLGFADRVEIRRIPGGDILPGQSVLIDYVIGPEPGGKTDTFGIGVDVRYSFDEGLLRGLSVYGQYFDQDETRSLITDDFPENDFTEIRYGLDYNVWKLYFRAERQERESTLSPFDVTRLEGRYTEPFGRGSSVVLSALYQDIDRSDSGIRTSTSTFSGQWNQRFDQNLRLSLLLQYQMTDDNISTNIDAFESQFDLVWQYRQFEFYGQVRYSSRNTTIDDTDFQRFIVGVRREF